MDRGVVMGFRRKLAQKEKKRARYAIISMFLINSFAEMLIPYNILKIIRRRSTVWHDEEVIYKYFVTIFTIRIFISNIIIINIIGMITILVITIILCQVCTEEPSLTNPSKLNRFFTYPIMAKSDMSSQMQVNGEWYMHLQVGHKMQSPKLLGSKSMQTYWR